jgi:hypothetical protein
MFRTLLAHPQEVRPKRHLVYCVQITTVGCDYNNLNEKCKYILPYKLICTPVNILCCGKLGRVSKKFRFTQFKHKRAV